MSGFTSSKGGGDSFMSMGNRNDEENPWIKNGLAFRDGKGYVHWHSWVRGLGVPVSRKDSFWAAGGTPGRHLYRRYAKGGYVNKPTLGLIGEAGDNEYVIPERRMAASAMAFLSGARGMDVVNPPKFANGGVVGSSVSNRSGNINALLERTGAIGGQTVVVQEPQINATIQVQTGDVLQFEGQQYVTFSDYQRGLKQVQSETLGLLRTAQGRRATGR